MILSQRQAGLSLVELLIVIAIVAMLVQLTLPAVQSAREAARQTSCKNNLHQMGVAMLLHESALGYLPTAGWGWAWMGDPARGPGKSQSGSWAYQLLPYLEQQTVYDIGLHDKGQAKHEALARLASTPVPIFYCPSRRLPEATNNMGPRVSVPGFEGEELFWFNAVRAPVLARTDYAANVGDLFVYWNEGPIPSKAEAGEGFFTFRKLNDEEVTLKDVTGVVMQRQPVTMAQIVDGASKTYFAGEKYLPNDRYDTGTNFTDDQSCWNGDDLDLVASTRTIPQRDIPKQDERDRRIGVPFGSAHPSGTHLVLCDGSVHHIGYTIDIEVHRQFGNRHDARKLKTSTP
jgi:prepilin-type N-terminal cleavage/methylation domain-containing protein